jgi:hypothetical protein
LKVDHLPPLTFEIEGVVMALQSDAIETRLEGLKQDDRRLMFDSKLRAFRMDSKTPSIAGNRASRLTRNSEGSYQVDQMIALLEELSRRIDGLEKKDRALAEEIRHQARQEQRRRSLASAAVVLFAGGSYICWLLNLL